MLLGANEILEDDSRHSAITSHSIGVPELTSLLRATERTATPDDYRTAVVDRNVLGLETANGRSWRYKTLRRLYHLNPSSLLFRALRDLWEDSAEAQPVIAGLCALATDTVFRATASVIIESDEGDLLRTTDMRDAVEVRFPSAYAASTLSTIGSKAYTSWEQTGHLGAAEKGSKPRVRAECEPASVTYALFLGYLQGIRGNALFETSWMQILDRPMSQLVDTAHEASQRRLLELRQAGGVIDVSFAELLRPVASEVDLPNQGVLL